MHMLARTHGDAHLYTCLDAHRRTADAVDSRRAHDVPSEEQLEFARCVCETVGRVPSEGVVLQESTISERHVYIIT